VNSINTTDVAVIGGGAAGFFGAIACAEARPGTRVQLLERGPNFLAKVKISGGGRCNVTHHCLDPKLLAQRYPRGGRALIGPFTRFQAIDTIKWFEDRGVALKTEADGRMFPTTDNSQTIIDCLMDAARRSGVVLRPNCGVDQIERMADGGFRLAVGRASLPGKPVLQAGEQIQMAGSSPNSSGGEARPAKTLTCQKLLLALGGCRAESAAALALQLGHTIEPPVPSLFTFQVADKRLEGLAGVAVDPATVTIPGTKLKETGPVLITHWGFSGPGILRASAWGARELARRNYTFTVRINWLGTATLDEAVARLIQLRQSDGAKLIRNVVLPPLTARLWERIVAVSGIPSETRWSGLQKPHALALARQLVEAEFQVTGKSLNKDEFVTCGGVKLPEVNFKTMESRVIPGLHFAGEMLDIDGVTGGFNFQAAWTTSWIAGRAMAEAFSTTDGHR
jgi:predicted flavoprotein YhiN